MYVGVIVVHHLPLIVTQSALSALLRMPYFLSFSVLRAGTRQASLKDKLEFSKFDDDPIILTYDNHISMESCFSELSNELSNVFL